MTLGANNLDLSSITGDTTAITYGIPNYPTSEQLSNLTDCVVGVYDKCCSYFGFQIPVIPSYRSIQLNNYIQGNQLSDKLQGLVLCMDIASAGRGVSNYQVFSYIENTLVFKELIWCYGTTVEPQYVYVSFDYENNIGRVTYKYGRYSPGF